MADGFLNPYNFVPIPDRALLPAALADALPAGHDRYLPDAPPTASAPVGLDDGRRWTGRIPITITCRTPLLLVDAARGTGRALPVRTRRRTGTGDDDRIEPDLAASSVKGMLRSAYEAITNSRLGVFQDHNQPLAMRRATGTRGMLPGWVVDATDDSATITVVTEFRPADGWIPPVQLTGLGPKFQSWPPLVTNVHPAPWVPLEHGRVTLHGIRDPRALDAKAVEAWVRLRLRPAKPGKDPRSGQPAFLIWQVCDLALPGELPPAPSTRNSRYRDAGHPAVHVSGLLHWTGATFQGDNKSRKNLKHDERLVVQKVIGYDGAAPGYKVEISHDTIPADSAAVKAWTAVIDSYARADAGESPAGLGSYVTHPEQWRLRPERTLHVLTTPRVRLFPAMIGREGYPASPNQLLLETHRPAPSIDRLSPADRVFGWVRPPNSSSRNARAAHRGHLRIDPPRVESGDPAPVRAFKDPVPLAALNTPKPQQYLFYVGTDDGRPVQGNRTRDVDDGFALAEHRKDRKPRRLRGRKTYLTHRDVTSTGDDSDPASDYWTPPTDRDDPETVLVKGENRYRDWAAPKGLKPKITTSVEGWVDEGTTFRTTLHLDNLTSTELAALSWLLTLPPNHLHHLGLGKPLGFGAVRIDIDADSSAPVSLYSGEDVAARYLSLGPVPAPTRDAAAVLPTLRDAYDEVLQTPGSGLREVRGAFLAAARGYDGLPVHYPRAAPEHNPGQRPVSPTSTSYDWWVANDKRGRRPLPPLTSDKAPELPYLSPKG